MKKITIKDIATKFNVSISTVSKALNDSYEISDKTKAKIKKYAKKKKYKPNFNALSLKNRRSKTIGIIIPNMLNYFFAQVFKGIEKTANENGYKMITCISNDSYSKELETMEMLSNGSIDGFIVSIAEETEMKNDFSHFDATIEQGTPVVMFDRVAKGVQCDKVVADNFDAAVKTVRHLKNTGCKNIAFVSMIHDLSVGKERYKGYLKGLENEQLAVNPDLILTAQENDYKKYEELIKPLFDNQVVDSVIATSEQSAIAAMKIAQKKGYQIPKDFSVIGFSNGILSRHSNPKLTTVSKHGEIMGETAAQMLIDKLEKEETLVLSTRIIQTDLVERNSTKTFLDLKSPV